MHEILTSTGRNAAIAAAAVIALTRKTFRVLHAVLTVTKRHVPAWIGAVLTACLIIPGPVDELFVLAVIGVMVAFNPVMRADLHTAIVAAWH